MSAQQGRKTLTLPKPVSTQTILNIVLVVLSIAAGATIILKYGGFSPEQIPFSNHTLNVFQVIIVGWFIIDRIIRLWIAKNKFEHLKHNWLDFALMLFFLVAIIIGSQIHSRFISAGAIYLIITQGYLFAVLLLRGISANLKLAGSGLPPSWLLMGSFAGLCLTGAGLLMLPASIAPGNYTNWNFTDAIFTAVSATCVTGLVVVDTGTHFSTFGQGVILCLIQLGGLGIMIFGTMLAVLTGKMLSIRSTKAIGEMLADTRLDEMARTVKFVVIITLIIEALGAIMLFPMFAELPTCTGDEMCNYKASWYSIFHSISAFCNAGFSLYSSSLMPGDTIAGSDEQWIRAAREHWQLLGVFAPLIIFGGLGFVVLKELLINAKTFIRRLWLYRTKKRNPLLDYPRVQFSLHSKVVIWSTVILIFGGALSLFITESCYNWEATDTPGTTRYRHEDWENMPLHHRVRECIFQSVTARTAGFNSIDMNKLSPGGKLSMCALMSIGGSPSSTAGGMKTSTVALLFLVVYSALRKRNDLEAFRRSISPFLLRRAVTLVVLYLALVLVVTIALSIAIKSESLINILFEACSACGTVGLSTGVTAKLGPVSKFIITIAMFIGRLGPLTLLIGITAGLKPADYSYPRENVIIG